MTNKTITDFRLTVVDLATIVSVITMKISNEYFSLYEMVQRNTGWYKKDNEKLEGKNEDEDEHEDKSNFIAKDK